MTRSRRRNRRSLPKWDGHGIHGELVSSKITPNLDLSDPKDRRLVMRAFRQKWAIPRRTGNRAVQYISHAAIRQVPLDRELPDLKEMLSSMWFALFLDREDRKERFAILWAEH